MRRVVPPRSEYIIIIIIIYFRNIFSNRIRSAAAVQRVAIEEWSLVDIIYVYLIISIFV